MYIFACCDINKQPESCPGRGLSKVLMEKHSVEVPFGSRPGVIRGPPGSI